MQILVINPGATSTKIAVFQDLNEKFKINIEHSQQELAPFSKIIDQEDFRHDVILRELAQAGYRMDEMDAVVGRGGLLRHIPSGTYRINSAAVDDLKHARMGEHASNLGVILSDRLAREYQLPAFFLDPVSVDELEPVARISGHPAFQRQSFFHALNQKSVARRASGQLGKPYEQTELIVAHLGGGVSVAAHHLGRVIDVYNVKDEGAFSMDRAGSLPVTQLIEYCFSGRSKNEVKRELAGGAGLGAYLGTRDLREVEKRIEQGDEQAALLFDALAYQLCKDMGAMATVLKGKIDAIVLTGGMAHSKKLCAAIEERVGFLAPLLIFAGEEEMASLAAGAYRVLCGEETARNYEAKENEQ